VTGNRQEIVAELARLALGLEQACVLDRERGPIGD
jgi:hypothetical protein